MSNTQKSLPKMALYLGYGGLIPFVGLSLLGFLGYKTQALLGISAEAWLAIYAAVIISFLGAIHWGVVIAMVDKLGERESNTLLMYGIMPSLLAWFSFLLSLKYALFILAGLVIVSYVCDHLFLFNKLETKLSKEFSKLRLHLTVIVSFLLFLSAINLIS